jgi:hypothetical protein
MRQSLTTASRTDNRMSRPNPPRPAKLVIGMFMADRIYFEPLATELEGRFGKIDIVSNWMPFDYTSYYEREMGAGLSRRMISFNPLIEQETLPDIKHFAYELEQRHSQDGRRRVNIDPGYLLLERFVLATGKNFAHRIYIGRHVYADLTLIYVDNAYRPLAWTYPDYTQADMLAFLYRVRKKYTYDLKHQDLT